MKTESPKLDLARLENVRHRGERIISACPACREIGGDRKGDNLLIFETGVFACAKNQGDKEHGRRILELAGLPRERKFSVTEHVRRHRPKPQKIAAPDSGKWEQIEPLTTKWRGQFYDNQAALAKFSAELGISVQTMQNCTSPAYDGLALIPEGYHPPEIKGPIRTPRLGFVYDGALKIRDPWPGSDIRFLLLDSPRRPWRSFWLQRPELTIQEVHVVESESDALALIDAGYERPFDKHGCAVIAAPGASAWKPDWGRFLAGREVHFWPDANPDGEKFIERVSNSAKTTATGFKRHAIKL